MTAAQEVSVWSAAPSGHSLLPGKTRYPFYRRLDGLQGRSGRAENFFCTGIRSRTNRPVVSLYTYWATGPTVRSSYELFLVVTDTITLKYLTFLLNHPVYELRKLECPSDIFFRFSILWHSSTLYSNPHTRKKISPTKKNKFPFSDCRGTCQHGNTQLPWNCWTKNFCHNDAQFKHFCIRLYYFVIVFHIFSFSCSNIRDLVF